MAEQTITHIVVKNGQAREHGTFFVGEGQELRQDNSTRYWAQLTCNTAFGIVGTFFGSMGAPAAQFLGHCNKDYILGRLWGLETEVYNGDVAKANLVKWVLQQRRRVEITNEEARELLDAIDCADFDSEHGFQSLVYGNRNFYQAFSEGGGSDYKVPNPQAEGFWEILWPGFLAELEERAEVAAHG